MVGSNSDARALELFQRPVLPVAGAGPLFYGEDGTGRYDKKPSATLLRVVRLSDRKVRTLSRVDRWNEYDDFEYEYVHDEFDISSERITTRDGEPFGLPPKVIEILFDVEHPTLRRTSHLLIRKEEHPEGVSEVASCVEFKVNVKLRVSERHYDEYYGEIVRSGAAPKLGMFLTKMFP